MSVPKLLPRWYAEAVLRDFREEGDPGLMSVFNRRKKENGSVAGIASKCD